jgi:phosphatidylglycerophosphatase A
MKLMKKFLTAVAFFAPALVLAQAQNSTPEGIATGIEGLAKAAVRALNAVVPVLLAVAGIVFIWGVVRYVITPDPTKKADAKWYIVWGIVGIAVILCFWGLATLLASLAGGSPDLGSGQAPGVQY